MVKIAHRALAALLLVIWVAHVQADGFVAAAGKVSVAPPVGVFMAGYGPDRRSTGELDRTFVKGAVIGAGDDLLVLLTVDCIGLTRPDVERVERGVAERLNDLPNVHIVVSSTHTHAGPDVVGIWGEHLWSSGRDEAYIDELINKSVDLAATLALQTQPVQSHVVSTQWRADWVENRSEPDLLDSQLSVMQFVDERGQSVVTLTNFACHPTVLDADNTLISADYLAGYYQAMASTLPGEHLFLQGAIGGWVQPLAAESDYDQALDIGAQLAQKVLQVLPEAKPNPYGPVHFRHRQVDVPLENWGFRLLMWLGVLDRETYDGHMRTDVATFELGDVVFMTHPGETSPAYSLASRALYEGRDTFVLGLTRDAMGYILKPEYFADDAPYPHSEYLTTVSVGPQAGPRIMQALQSMVETSQEDER